MYVTLGKLPKTKIFFCFNLFKRIVLSLNLLFASFSAKYCLAQKFSQLDRWQLLLIVFVICPELGLKSVLTWKRGLLRILTLEAEVDTYFNKASNLCLNPSTRIAINTSWQSLITKTNMEVCFQGLAFLHWIIFLLSA